MNIIAFPFAGGSSYSYAKLARQSSCTWITFDPSGHGKRMREPLLASIPDIVSDLLEQVLPVITEDRYVLFGHSMGAYIALAMLDRLAHIGAPLPSSLVLSGAPPPHRRQNSRHAHLPKPAFLDWIAAMGGVPAEVLAEPELMELFEPILRADVAAVEAYVDSTKREYPVRVRVLVGKQDRIAYPDVQAWSECFASAVDIVEFLGGHFFLFDDVGQVSVWDAVEQWESIKADCNTVTHRQISA